MKLSETQRHQLQLLSQAGVSRHIPRPTAAVLVRLGLIEWCGPTSSGDGMQAGGYMLTEAGKAALAAGVAPVEAPSLPRSDSTEAIVAIEAVLAERNYPTSTNAAGRAGWEAAFRWLLAHGVGGTDGR